mgnify:CR=1 FL=1
MIEIYFTYIQSLLREKLQLAFPSLKDTRGISSVEYIIIALIMVIIIALVFNTFIKGGLSTAAENVGRCITSGGSNC